MGPNCVIASTIPPSGRICPVFGNGGGPIARGRRNPARKDHLRSYHSWRCLMAQHSGSRRSHENRIDVPHVMAANNSRMFMAPREKIQPNLRPFVPPVLIMPAVSRLSLIVIGTPCSGPLSSCSGIADSSRNGLERPIGGTDSRDRIAWAILVAGHFTVSLTASFAQRFFNPLLDCRRKSILGKCFGMIWNR